MKENTLFYISIFQINFSFLGNAPNPVVKSYMAGIQDYATSLVWFVDSFRAFQQDWQVLGNMIYVELCKKIKFNPKEKNSICTTQNPSKKMRRRKF